MNGELALLLRLHDGDDRCGCLGRALLLACTDGPTQAILTRWEIEIPDLIRSCLEHHPSGSVYRSLHRSV